jgi:hypothetical protein
MVYSCAGAAGYWAAGRRLNKCWRTAGELLWRRSEEVIGFLDGELRMLDMTPVVLEMLELLKELEEARGSSDSGNSGVTARDVGLLEFAAEVSQGADEAGGSLSSRLPPELAGGRCSLLGVEARSGRDG